MPAIRTSEGRHMPTRDAEGYYVASVPQMPACHTQDEIHERIQDAIELRLEVEGAADQILLTNCPASSLL